MVEKQGLPTALEFGHKHVLENYLAFKKLDFHLNSAASMVVEHARSSAG